MKAICVYCGSSSGTRILYQERGKELGEILASRGLSLVFGGSRFGLMGQVAEGALSKGGKVVGVLPEALKSREVAHSGLSELHIVKNMHERKAKMADLADAFIALPGGFGTLDEVMEMITWNQLNFQAKPIGFLNVDGFYALLFQFLEKAAEDGFINPGLVKALVLESEPGILVERLSNEPWPKLAPWPVIS